MATRERHFVIDDEHSIGTITLTVEGMKGVSFWVYRTQSGPYSARIVEGWTAGNVTDAKSEARLSLLEKARKAVR